MSLFKGNKFIIGLTLLVLILKFVLLPFAQTTDPDAVTRIFNSERWLQDPHWIETSVWGPLHYYLNALGLWIWNDRVIAPKVINILLSSLTLLPFFFFVKREFNEKGAKIASLVLAFSPILFRGSFLALSETPYLFLVALAINLLSLSIHKNGLHWAGLSGFCITLAAGFRYEAWPLMAALALIPIFQKKIKIGVVFTLFAGIFPLIWMWSNYSATGDPFYSISGNYHWTQDVMHNNDQVTAQAYFRRSWFFFFTLFIAIGPVFSFLFLKGIGKTFKTEISNYHTKFWLIPLFAMFVLILYNAIQGTLLLHHRFIGTVVLLGLPFVANTIKDATKFNLKHATGSVLLTLLLTCVYNTEQITPVPRLQNSDFDTVLNEITTHLSEEDALFIDFFDWESGYFLALNSPCKVDNIVIVDGYSNTHQIISELPENPQRFYLLHVQNCDDSFEIVWENRLYVLAQKKVDP